MRAFAGGQFSAMHLNNGPAYGKADPHVPVIIRVPTIPGMNDSVENIRRTAEFAHSLGEDVSLNLLPYHKLGEIKNENLGHPFSLGIEPPDDKHMNTLLSIVRDCGVTAQIGG